MATLRRHVDPVELALQRLLALTLALLITRQLLPLLLKPTRIVPTPGDPVAALKLEDPASDIVEKVAIVSHRDHGALVLLEVALKPCHRLGVQMVRRLIEQ